MDASSTFPQATSGSASANGKTRVDVLKQQVIAHIEQLQREGFVDEYIRMSYGLKDDTSEKTFFIDLVSTFVMETAATIDDMIDTLEYPIIDYDKLYQVSMKLKGSSSFIGACQLSTGCINLIHAIVNKYMNECRRIVEKLNKDKVALEMKLVEVMKLEHEIVADSE